MSKHRLKLLYMVQSLFSICGKLLSTLHINLRVWVAVILLSVTSLSSAQIGVYQTLESFLEQVFKQAPAKQTLWLNEDIRNQLSEVLERNYRGLRVRYWRSEDRTVWVMNEIGKERPITSAIAVENNKIAAVSVLEYRESRGGEVRLPSFRRQFIDVGLNNSGKLDQGIDGITGATMSVRTLSRSAVAALNLHRIVTEQKLPDQTSNVLSKIP